MKNSVLLFSAMVIISVGLYSTKHASARHKKEDVKVSKTSIHLSKDDKYDEVAIVADYKDPVISFAAKELSDMLGQIYTDVRFSVNAQLPASEKCILLGTGSKSTIIRQLVNLDAIKKKDAYVIDHGEFEKTMIGVIAGHSPRAVLYGVYGLLEELGYGFYLSYTASPPKKYGDFGFEKWDIKDTPLSGPRIAFNWHNFLSSCSTWDFPHWQQWIAQVARMRYSSIMLHVYGNNPMFHFSHKEMEKPVGYLTTTNRGRDWYTPHVNDVRRLHGGRVFNEAIFGAKVAKVPLDKRVDAVKKLIREVFDEAVKRGLDIYFAIDVDTKSANPQNIIKSLPTNARFQSANGYWLANPDTKSGYAYYKSLVQSLLESYPQITDLILWHRHHRATPWRKLTIKHFPKEWKLQFQNALKQHPQLSNNQRAMNIFALSRIVSVFQKILKDLDMEHVDLGVGTWRFDDLPSWSLFMPEDLQFLPLDGEQLVGKQEFIASLKKAEENYRLIPIIWAHDDVDRYAGRCFAPAKNFSTIMNRSNSKGFGIIHWIKRPLDLYFKSHAEQVWEKTKNQSLPVTCHLMANRTFGKQHEKTLGNYLERWVKEAPMFGHSTLKTNKNSFHNARQWFEDSKDRLSVLKGVQPDQIRKEGRCHYQYFKQLEEFYLKFIPEELCRREVDSLLKNKKVNHARDLYKRCDPVTAIETFTSASEECGISRGEKGLIINFNCYWRTVYENLGQQLGIQPIRFNYQPTQHETLAQSPGTKTYFIDKQNHFWLGLGAHETGVPVWGNLPQNDQPLKPEREISQTGLRSMDTIKLNNLKTMQDSSLLSGIYRVDLLFPVNVPQASGLPHKIAVMMNGKEKKKVLKFEVNLDDHNKKDEPYLVVSHALEVDKGSIDILLSGIDGPAVISGIVLKPVKVY